ncbi:MAG: hypothetical protein H3Z54_00970 [archaeon]|nr:hypothetical protein [archaeon]
MTVEQSQLLKKHAADFLEWLKTPKGQADVKEHRDHEKYVKDKLSPENIDKLDEDEFRQFYKTLWVSNFWGNKDWYIDNKLITRNGLDRIKRELKKLLYGSEDFVLRYDTFHENVKGFGPSAITEILHFIYPEKFCLWNEKPKTVLPYLGLSILPQRFFKYGITNGSEYMQCVGALQVIKDELKDFGIKDSIDLDVFFWYIFSDVIPSKPKDVITKGVAIQKPSKIQIDSHEAAEYYLLELGKTLGYLSYTVDQQKTYQGKRLGEVALVQQIPPFAGERDMSSAREIDVIWFNEDENPECCFEVEHTTDIVHGLDRLIQLQHLYVKFIIVAPEDKRSKFEALLQRVQYRRIRDRFRFISYEELATLYEHALPFHDLKVRLLGE